MCGSTVALHKGAIPSTEDNGLPIEDELEMVQKGRNKLDETKLDKNRLYKEIQKLCVVDEADRVDLKRTIEDCVGKAVR